MSVLLQQLAVQRRVIFALMMREVHTRYGRENIGFFWLVGEPALFCAGVTLMWSAIRPAHEHGVPIVAFVITGYVPLTMWRHCVARSVRAFVANGSLMFHRQVTPLDILLARVILEIYGALMAAVAIGGAAILIGVMEPPADFGMLYAGLAYEALFCLASALILAPLSEMSEIVEKFVVVLTYLAIPFSGAFTMVDWVSKPFQDILLWSPSVNAVEMIRAGQFGPAVHPIYSVSYTTWSNALLILIGVSLVLRSRKYIVVQ